MKYTISKDFYPKTVVLKAAYAFTDRAYIFISQDENNYVIEIESKDNKGDVAEKEFKNELLSQALRYEIDINTKNVRELIISRALASTIIDEENDVIEYEDQKLDDDILKDWFENDENSSL